MPLKTLREEDPQLNLTPMIDIVFLLVIFFMVGSQFADLEDQLKLDLPKLNTARAISNQPDDLIINIRKDGVLFLNRDQKSESELEVALKEAKEKYAQQRVRIRGDGSIRYQRLMDVLEICKNKAGIEQVSLSVQMKEQLKRN